MKILAVGDGARLTSGFGRVMRETLSYAVRQGHQVVQIAALDAAPVSDPAWYVGRGITPILPAGADTVGMDLFGPAIVHHRPDVILAIGDAITVAQWCEQRRRLPAGIDVPPVVAYVPIEGAPLNPRIVEALKRPDVLITCTQWGSAQCEMMLGHPVPYVYHGVRAGEWLMAPGWNRESVRASLGWAPDDVVLTYVARNQMRKSQDKLIEALAILRAKGYPCRLYLHCAPWERGWNGGWNLHDIAEAEGVAEYVQFPALNTAVHGVGVATLAERLAAADLYVHPSKVEGFGLPLVEAMAVGLPVIATMDRGNMTEIVEAFGLLMPADYWDTWHNGARLACVKAETIAGYVEYAIDQMRAGPEWPFPRQEGRLPCGQSGSSARRQPPWCWLARPCRRRRCGPRCCARRCSRNGAGRNTATPCARA